MDLQLASYINAYNALAMYAVSQSKLEPKNVFRFFVVQKVKLAGAYTSLYALENRKIRPYGEPRIHFALNCMVRGCPTLPTTPFTGEDLEQQLHAAAVKFCNHKQHVQVLHPERKVYLSKIFKWYRKDFLRESDSLISYVNKYRQAQIPDDYAVDFLPYNWSLNEL